MIDRTVLSDWFYFTMIGEWLQGGLWGKMLQDMGLFIV